jgi:LysM repeat protein
MLKYSLIIILFILSIDSNAQGNDSLFAMRNGTNWIVRYTLKTGETKQMLAKRFYLMDGIIENTNSIDNDKKLGPGTSINIPVAPENYFVIKPAPMELINMRELYYRVVAKDDIEMISTYAAITKAEMRKMNNLRGNTLAPGQALFIGWLKMMAKDSASYESQQAYYFPRKKMGLDSAKQAVPGGLDTVYSRQTNNGLNVLNEKGTAVFFDKPGKNNIYYAFHNSTPRGSIIKVLNPGTGKFIYVKVLGPLPDTKVFANSIIGISNAAREALGVSENKAWCELTYATN